MAQSAAETIVPYSGRSPAKPDGDEANVQTILYVLTGKKNIVSTDPSYLNIPLLEAVIASQQLSIQLKTNEFLRVYREKLNAGDYNCDNPKQQQNLKALRETLSSLYTCPTPKDQARLNDFIKENLKVLLADMLLYTGEMELFCNKQTCQQMKGYSTQIYLCAAHAQPKECCAIDYSNDTICALIEVLKSRSLTQKRSQASVFQYFVTAVRRAHRIFLHLHAYHFAHFIRLERNLLLCTRFELFCEKNTLLNTSTFLEAQVKEVLGSSAAKAQGMDFPSPTPATEAASPPVHIECPPNVDKGHYIISNLRSQPVLNVMCHPDLVPLGMEQPLSRYNLPPTVTFEEEKSLPNPEAFTSSTSTSTFAP